jgi:mRNA-degrading endonuclease RelE of RelBE toxin-antitoxin system
VFVNVYYTDTARQQLKELKRHFQKRILDKVALHASQPNPLEFAEPLTGYDMYRFRVGDYRAAFQIDQNILYIKSVGIGAKPSGACGSLRPTPFGNIGILGTGVALPGAAQGGHPCRLLAAWA